MNSIKKAVKLLGGPKKAAEALGVSKQWLHVVMAAKSFPSTKLVWRIEKATGEQVTSEEIFTEMRKEAKKRLR